MSDGKLTTEDRLARLEEHVLSDRGWQQRASVDYLTSAFPEVRDVLPNLRARTEWLMADEKELRARIRRLEFEVQGLAFLAIVAPVVAVLLAGCGDRWASLRALMDMATDHPRAAAAVAVVGVIAAWWWNIERGVLSLRAKEARKANVHATLPGVE